ncbi:MAG: hypothetical protein IT245_03815 [Bacteroidia bacterium]|nr:hypothetical protein [Bacteroidia bacterium]
MNLEIKAKHFVDAVYAEPCGCAISNAAKEIFPGKFVAEGVDELEISEKHSNKVIGSYSHEEYDQSMFDADKLMADASTDPEKVIRTILLIKQ